MADPLTLLASYRAALKTLEAEHATIAVALKVLRERIAVLEAEHAETEDEA